MAKGQHLSSYQKGIVKRYYEHKGDIGAQKLGEIVTELYLETNPKKIERLWKSAETALKNAGANPARMKVVLEKRDVKELAELAGKLF